MCPSDTLAALNDGILPADSADRSIPRFTWWDHRGTGEWVEYSFAKPRKLTFSEVYWFEDRGIGGGCNAPIAWRMVFKDGGWWRPVPVKGPYVNKHHAFNRVEFDPIVTTQIRIVADLFLGLSSRHSDLESSNVRRANKGDVTHFPAGRADLPVDQLGTCAGSCRLRASHILCDNNAPCRLSWQVLRQPNLLGRFRFDV
jgi:hypothetical protein